MVRVSRWFALAVLLGIGLLSAGVPAHAQFWGGPRQGGGGFFGGLFSGEPQQYERQRPRWHREVEPRHEPQADSSHAPPPRKSEAKDAPSPSTTILVLGDGMAGWLAYGLEDAFSDSPDVGIVRKDKPYSGLLRYDAKNDLDWWHVARDILAQQKPSYIVMMLGVTDRQNIRERDLAKEAEREAKEQEEKKAAEKKAADEKAAAAKNPDGKIPDGAAADKDKPEAEKKTAEQPKPARPTGNLEFRSEQWEKVYTKRIDETIAALKSKGVPVFWVGLPPIKGTKSTADTNYLDGLFRARAQRAGIVYVDVWDGFVDDNGRYTSFGPDYEGQNRRLRSGDGVYFTKYGARKLAHYVEREIRRYMSNRIVALPSPTAVPTTPGKPTERPLAGPVVPLAATPVNSDELLGPGAKAHGDALAARALVRGEAIASQPGRADDFAWPPGSSPKPAAAEPAKAPAAKKPEAAAKPHAPIAAVPAKPVEPPKPAEQMKGPTVAPPPHALETEASVKPAEPPLAEPQPPVAATPVAAVAPDAASKEDASPASVAVPEPAPAEARHKAQHTKRAEARPRPAQHSGQRPPRAVQQQRGLTNPFSELFGSFR